MRRISLWVTGTMMLLVLLVTYRTSTAGPGVGTTTAAAAGSRGPVTNIQSGQSGSATTVDGSVAQTRWGPVQVRVKLSGRTIVDVVVLQQPNGNRQDAQINSYALPRLRQQVLSAQSAQIDGVSGATVTSDGYVRSLSAALTAAGIG